MLMTIAIRGEVKDEAEAQTILEAVTESVNPIANVDLTISPSVTIVIELPPPPP